MTYHWAHLVDAAWDRFLKYVDTSRGPMGCWLWTGGKSRGARKSWINNNLWYGSFFVGKGVSVRAHIFMAVACGFGVPGEHRDHLCLNPLCVNPLHLEPTSPAENVARARTSEQVRRAA